MKGYPDTFKSYCDTTVWHVVGKLYNNYNFRLMLNLGSLQAFQQ